MWKRNSQNHFMDFWIFILFTKELMVSWTQADVSPPPASSPSQPLTVTDMEVLRQHLLANGRWLLGLGKEELRLLGKLTGSDIGGDLLVESQNLDYIQPDFGSPVNPYQSGYPGTSINETKNNTTDIHPTSSAPNSDNLAIIHPTFSPDISSSMTSQLDQQSSNYTYNLTAPFSPSITDPSDDEIVFSPIQPTNPTSPNPPSQAASSNNSNDVEPPEDTKLSPPNPAQSVSNETSSSLSGNQNSPPSTEAPINQKPTVDPLIYPVQFYNETSLSEVLPSTHPSPGKHFNPLADLAETFSDNFNGW